MFGTYLQTQEGYRTLLRAYGFVDLFDRTERALRKLVFGGETPPFEALASGGQEQHAALEELFASANEAEKQLPADAKAHYIHWLNQEIVALRTDNYLLEHIAYKPARAPLLQYEYVPQGRSMQLVRFP